MTDRPALSFGEELRRERLIREISLEEISSATKISLRLLKALEAGDTSRLPAPAFTRGFIRAYARHLGIDPEEKVNAYLADLAGESPAAPGRQKARSRSRFWRGRRATAGTIVGGVTAILLLLGLIASPQRRARPSLEKPVSARATAVALKNVSVSGESSPTIREAPVFADVPGVSLLLEFDDDSWTKLDADGQTVLEGLMRRGESKRFEARAGFRLTLGNAGGVRVTVDGQALEKLGGAGKVVRDYALPAAPARG
ncbi:MAG: helix-turn-helix domain-containing protein [Thermoanaerobaculia bacterium]